MARRPRRGSCPRSSLTALAGFLGVDQPRVPAGVASWHVLTTNLTANTPVARAAGANTAAAFTSSSVEPGRVQGAFVVRREDVARFPGMESALRENLSNVLMDQLDREILNGSGGLLNDGLTQPSVPGSTVDFDGYTDLVAERVDGLYASTTGSVRLLVGANTYQHAIKQYRATTADGPSALQYLMNLAGGHPCRLPRCGPSGLGRACQRAGRARRQGDRAGSHGATRVGGADRCC